MTADGENMINISDEKRKILDGTYPSKVITGRQNKHIEGTREFEQNREKMQKFSPGSEPAILNTNAQILVDTYKGTGIIDMVKGSEYPRETIVTNKVVGKTWVQSLNKYVETSAFIISYSKTGVHVIPVNEEGRK